MALTQRTNHGIVAADSFGFDARGNVTLNASGATFNVLDQLTSTAACASHSYDAAGNLTARTCGAVTWAYTYDALDRLTHVTNTSGLSAAYTYDVLGTRIAKRVGTDTTRFVWRGGHVLYETTGGGTLTYSYQWGLETDDLLAIHDHGSGAHYYVVQDRLRSVRGLVNRTGSWVAAWRYRAYGVGLDSAGTAAAGLKRFRWAGAQYDAETGFYFLRTRYYDPSVGRFVQEDKVGRAGGANLYAYAGGEPLGRRDPGGTMFTYDLQYSGYTTNNCWDHTACNWDGFDGRDTGGGGGDWNGDGMSDWYEFTEYSWGAQHWRSNGGTTEQWRDVWNCGVLRQQNPGLRSALMEVAFWGDIRPMYWGAGPYSDSWAVTKDTFFILENERALPQKIGDPGRTRIWLNLASPILDSQTTPHQLAFTLAHEMWHYGNAIRGLEEPKDAERRANCFAYSSYGWNSPLQGGRCQ